MPVKTGEPRDSASKERGSLCWKNHDHAQISTLSSHVNLLSETTFFISELIRRL